MLILGGKGSWEATEVTGLHTCFVRVQESVKLAILDIWTYEYVSYARPLR